MTRWDAIVSAIKAIKRKFEQVDTDQRATHALIGDLAVKQDRALDALEALAKDLAQLRISVTDAIERQGLRVQQHESRVTRLERLRWRESQ